MGLKRTIAQIQIAQRKREREKIEKETRRLALKRNKALKDAASKAKKAQALERGRQAELKKLKAEERLNLQRKVNRKKRTEKAVKIGRGIVKTFKQMRREYNKR